MLKEKSFENALNNIDPTIEPCGTPKIMSLKSRYWHFDINIGIGIVLVF